MVRQRISQLYILSPRGDKIIAMDYRSDIARGTDEIFFRKYKFWDGPGGSEAPPFFSVDGINYGFLRKNGLLFVITTRVNISPSILAELLTRLTKLLKDYLGVLTEEALRRNFTLAYELLDEVIDFGYLQSTSTEKLVPYIFNEPVAVTQAGQEAAAGPGRGVLARLGKAPVTRQHADAQKSVVGPARDSRKNEVFVDVIERLNAVFHANGALLTQDIDGAIIMKSFLAGSPLLRLGLNPDLVIGRDSKQGSYGGVVLDNANFHERVSMADFESDRALSFSPPDGEFTIMHYRITGTDHVMPFRVTSSSEASSPYLEELTLRIRADFPTAVTASAVTVKFGVPRTCTGCRCDVGSANTTQSCEYAAAERAVLWRIRGFPGSSEQVCRARMSLSQPSTAPTRSQIGPVTLNFEIPQFVVSGLSIRYLRIEERSKGYNPQRWVRNITQANSYVCRLS